MGGSSSSRGSVGGVGPTSSPSFPDISSSLAGVFSAIVDGPPRNCGRRRRLGGDSSDVAAGALVWCVGRSDGERVDDGLWCGGGGGGGGGHEGNNDEAAGRVGGSREAPRLISGFVGRGGSAAATTCQLLTAAAIYGAAGGTVLRWSRPPSKLALKWAGVPGGTWIAAGAGSPNGGTLLCGGSQMGSI